jgi:hypothetical protein
MNSLWVILNCWLKPKSIAGHHIGWRAGARALGRHGVLLLRHHGEMVQSDNVKKHMRLYRPGATGFRATPDFATSAGSVVT